MPFSVDEICRLATVMPGDLIIYKLNQDRSGRILYYSKGMPDFIGVTPEVYAAGVLVDIPLQPEMGEEIVINQEIYPLFFLKKIMTFILQVMHLHLSLVFLYMKF